MNKKLQICIAIIVCLFFTLDIVKGDTVNNTTNNDFTNITLLNSLFEKLYRLENSYAGQDKVNIVHIGDSHIQADFFTNTIRQALQAKFGNGGYGFTFPYKLANTNGSNYISYTSNIDWDSRRNVFPITDVSIGLSGIGFYTSDSKFLINLEAKPPYNFNTIKIIYPTKEPSFTIKNTGNIPLIVRTPKISYTRHKIKLGETLSSIARKYSVTVESLKRANKLKSNVIHKGKMLVVKTNVQTEQQVVPIDDNNESKNDSSFYLNRQIVPYSSTFRLSQLTSSISICPNKEKNNNSYNLNGIILENSNPGLIYSNIGVNGAKVSDYLKYPLFFEQLPLLKPDLIIVSFGTNESYGKWSAPYFVTQTKEFIDKIKVKNPKSIILIMSPPPSLLWKNASNTFIDSYAKMLGQLNGCVYWNLLDKLGGFEAPKSQSFAQYMARDKVHYTKEGYEMQGELFLTDFMSAYENYVKNRKTWTQY